MTQETLDSYEDAYDAPNVERMSKPSKPVGSRADQRRAIAPWRNRVARRVTREMKEYR
jgi:hypothetical protein